MASSRLPLSATALSDVNVVEPVLDFAPIVIDGLNGRSSLSSEPELGR